MDHRLRWGYGSIIGGVMCEVWGIWKLWGSGGDGRELMGRKGRGNHGKWHWVGMTGGDKVEEAVGCGVFI